MSKPKVAQYDSRGNLTGRGDGVFVHLNDYEALAEKVGTLCPECIEERQALAAENKRLRDMLSLAYDCCSGGCGTGDECIFEEWRQDD